MAPAASVPRLVRRLVLATLVALATAEVLLQVAYGVVWWSRAAPATPLPADSAMGPTVLCVGDSFTYGMGSSRPERSYPAQLEAELRKATGAPWRVDNRGWPGRNSRELLQLVDGWLAANRPDYLCVLVGTNDGWSRPARLVLSEEPSTVAATPGHEPYVWTCRLWRLASVFRGLGAFRDQPPEEPLRPAAAATTPVIGTTEFLVGSWVLLEQGVEVTLAADGSGTLAGQSLRWRVDGAELRLDSSALPPLAGVWREDQGALLLQPAAGAPVRLVRNTSVEAQQGRHRHAGLAALGRRDWAGAERELNAALADAAPAEPATAMLREGLARALLALGKRAEALAQLEALRRLSQAGADRLVDKALAGACLALGLEDEAFERYSGLLQQDPEDVTVWSEYAALADQRGERAAARTAIDRALTLAARQRLQCSFLWRRKALFYLADAAALPVVAECATLAHLEDGSDDRTRALLAMWPGDGAAKDGALRGACEAISAPGEVEAVLLQLRREASGEGGAKWQDVLRSHLRQVLQRCRRVGTVPILSTYPFRSELNQVLKAFAAAEQCVLVEIDVAIAANRAAAPERVLFVADGHCNDDGYGVMAAAMARHIESLWRATGRQRGAGGAPAARGR